MREWQKGLFIAVSFYVALFGVLAAIVRCFWLYPWQAMTATAFVAVIFAATAGVIYVRNT